MGDNSSGSSTILGNVAGNVEAPLEFQDDHQSIAVQLCREADFVAGMAAVINF